MNPDKESIKALEALHKLHACEKKSVETSSRFKLMKKVYIVELASVDSGFGETLVGSAFGDVERSFLWLIFYIKF